MAGVDTTLAWATPATTSMPTGRLLSDRQGGWGWVRSGRLLGDRRGGVKCLAPTAFWKEVWRISAAYAESHVSC